MRFEPELSSKFGPMVDDSQNYVEAKSVGTKVELPSIPTLEQYGKSGYRDHEETAPPEVDVVTVQHSEVKATALLQETTRSEKMDDDYHAETDEIMVDASQKISSQQPVNALNSSIVRVVKQANHQTVTDFNASSSDSSLLHHHRTQGESRFHEVEELKMSPSL